MFGNKEKDSKKPAEIGFGMNKIYLWVRGIESKVNNIKREIEIIKNNYSQKYEKINKEIKTINDDLIEVKREQQKTNEKFDLIIKELKLTVGKDEVMTIKKYIDLWNPMNFVTQRDIERIIEEKIKER